MTAPMAVAPAAPPLILPPSLSEAEARAVLAFRDWLLQTMPGQVERLILFGSKARDDAHPHSDVDVLVVVKEITREQDDRVADYMGHALVEKGVNLAVIVLRSKNLQEQIEIGTPFVRNIAKDGIPLLGEGFTVGKGKPEEVARKFLKGAHERLTSTRMLVEGGQYRDAISRAYYAALDAADGALALVGVTPQSHEGTITFFSKHFIKSGQVDSRYGSLLNKIQKARLTADYNRMIDFTEDDARRALVEAEDFVNLVEALISKRLAEQGAEEAEGEASQEGKNDSTLDTETSDASQN